MDDSKFKLKIGDKIKDDKRDFIVSDMEYRIKKKKRGKGFVNANERYYKLHCNTCGWDDLFIEEWNLLNGKGCSCCHGKTVVEGINDITTTASWMIPYFQGGYDEAKLYTYGSDKQIYPVCPDCGKVKDKLMTISNIYTYKSINCECGDGISYPNKFILNLIKQCSNQIKYYETEYSPNWIKPKRYDMYIITNDNQKYIIEMDGGLGHGNMSQYPKSAKLSTKNDVIKEKLAKENNIEMIRIKCEPSSFDVIKNNILNSKLNTILNLSDIDWIKCDKESMKNLIKEVCMKRNENNSLTTTQLSKIFNIHYATIGRYLKIGTRVGWCDYNPKLEQRNAIKNAKYNYKKVVCITTNELFKSMREASEYYDVCRSSIQKCCLNQRNKAGNLKWRYYDELNDNISSFLLPKEKNKSA